MEFEKLRNFMVEEQIRKRGIKDERVLSVLLKVPREIFVPENLKFRAYDDCALPIGFGQTISQPYIVALMTELLELNGNEKVLEIGTGSGYQTAILCELSKEVYTIERIRELSDLAKERLDFLGYRNVKFFVEDGTLGLEKCAPFDRIIVTAAGKYIPDTLKKQLANNGIIVAPIGERFFQILVKLIKHGDIFDTYKITGVSFVPLIGKYGWDE